MSIFQKLRVVWREGGSSPPEQEVSVPTGERTGAVHRGLHRKGGIHEQYEWESLPRQVRFKSGRKQRRLVRCGVGKIPSTETMNPAGGHDSVAVLDTLARCSEPKLT